MHLGKGDKSAGGSLRGLRAALLVGALSLAPGLALAGPAEDAAANAQAIQTLLDAGKSGEGEALARQATAAAEAALGADAAATANLYRLLGDALFNQKRYAEAEPFFRLALAGRDKALGPDHPDTARSAGDLAITLRWLKQYDEAEALYRRTIAIREKTFGPDSADVAQSWRRLALLFDAKRDYAGAAEAMGRAVAVATKAFGPRHRTVALWIGDQAAEHHDAGNTEGAEPLYRQAIGIGEEILQSDDPDLANFRQGLANLLRQTARPAEAEPLYRAALAGREKARGKADLSVASSLEGLGRALDMLDRQADSVPLYRRAVEIREKSASGAAVPLELLGLALIRLDRTEEAEPVFRRLLVMFEKRDGPDGESVAKAVRWLASVAARRDRNAEAEILYKRALAISVARLGADDPLTGFDLLMLGMHYAAQLRLDEAEPLLDRAVSILDKSGEVSQAGASTRMALAMLKMSRRQQDEAAALAERALADLTQALGPDDLETVSVMVTLAQIRLALGDVGAAERLAEASSAVLGRKAPEGRTLIRTRSILGSVRLAQGRAGEAEEIYAGVIELLAKRYGEDDPELKTPLADLGRAQFALGRYGEAIGNLEKSVALTERLAAIDAEAAFAARTGKIEDQAIGRGAVYDLLVKAYDRLGKEQSASASALAERAFLVAQRVIESQAAAALAQMAARQSAGNGELATLVRQRQDLVDDWRRHDRKLTEARSAAGRNSANEAELADRLSGIDRQVREIDARLATGFPAFATLQKPASLDFATVQAKLADDEVLLFFADTSQAGDEGFETYLWAVPKTGAPRFVRLDRSTGEVSAAVRNLRSLMGVGPQSRGVQSLVAAKSEDRTAAVLAAAESLYRTTLLPVADMIAGKDLVVVPSKKLSGLPFHLLVAAPPPSGSTDRYRDAGWIARDHAVTVLPSVASLAAAATTAAYPVTQETYFGFANPLLTGRGGNDMRAYARQACRLPAEPDAMLVAAAELPDAGALFRGAAADVDAVRQLVPLPETTDEACAIAAALGAGDDQLRLGADATEAEAKSLSESGRLARSKILHFATHGLVSGELSGLVEPAIVLTPPAEASARDDGLLTASEVTTLKLNADWVILSACNTASGDGGGEALSGLARAFFYAGARSLMVSHWPVNSDAAVSLATGAIGELATDPAIGKAEALRRSMLAEVARGGTHADPANWAPFILVGASR
jgi:CHAT domain-containing protein/tetratricopeptide (TPR) repeat protein